MMLSPRMRWKIERYRRMLLDKLDSVRSLARASMVQQKVCPACRALVDAREGRCPFCNERLGALDRIGVKRVMTRIVPGGFSYSIALLAANFLMFGLSIFAAMRTGAGPEAIAEVPLLTLVNLGARDYLVGYGEVWRLVTAMFLHGGLIHLLFNSLVLYDVGPAVEEMYGKPRFLVLYVFAGIMGSIFSYLWHPQVVMVGASGALFGLIGVMIAYGYRHRTSLGEQVKAMYVRWAIYGLLFGFLIPGIDNAAHIGGLAGGFAFGMMFSDAPSFSAVTIQLWRVASYLVLFVIVASFLMVGLNYGRVVG